ncbi:MAG: hypothetical protein O2890_14805 [Cyanobacteria bacterium]|nr:hypothetical protein [Cyanobacteriota bacterium]MDA0867640.1 hypothetical protein [Cyanobacteriota bacterium]
MLPDPKRKIYSLMQLEQEAVALEERRETLVKEVIKLLESNPCWAAPSLKRIGLARIACSHFADDEGQHYLVLMGEQLEDVDEDDPAILILPIPTLPNLPLPNSRD